MSIKSFPMTIFIAADAAGYGSVGSAATTSTTLHAGPISSFAVALASSYGIGADSAASASTFGAVIGGTAGTVLSIDTTSSHYDYATANSYTSIYAFGGGIAWTPLPLPFFSLAISTALPAVDFFVRQQRPDFSMPDTWKPKCGFHSAQLAEDNTAAANNFANAQHNLRLQRRRTRPPSAPDVINNTLLLLVYMEIRSDRFAAIDEPPLLLAIGQTLGW
jgi:hypothetical protein